MVEQTFFFINMGFYFQFPLFDYLYSGINPEILRTGAKNVLAGNPNLDPERTIAWELGLKREINPNTVASVTYFNKKFANQIDAKTLVPFDSKFAGDYGFAQYVNNAQASAYGIELVLTRQNEYADSRRRDVVARLDANKAIAQLRQAVGSTLDAYKIRLQ